MKDTTEERNQTVIKVLRLREQSIDGWGPAIQQSLECKRYLCHEHYTDDQKRQASKYKKPLLRYNILLSKLLTIQGHAQINSRMAKIIPMYNSDSNAVQLLNDNFNAIQEQEDLETKLGLIHMDALSYRVGGWLGRSIEPDELGYLNFKYTVLSGFNVHPDPAFRSYDMSDCKFVIVDSWMDWDNIKTKFKISPDSDKYTWWKQIVTDAEVLITNQNDGEYKRGDKYLVCELQERRYVDAWLCSVDDGEELETLSEEDIKKMRSKKHKIRVVKPVTDSRIYYTTVIPHLDKVIQEKQFPFPSNRFGVFPCFSFNMNIPKSEQSSLMYVLIDIQDRINKGMSQQVDFVTQALGAPWHVPKHEREAVKTLKEKGNMPGVVIEYLSMNNKAVRDPAPNVPTSILETLSVDLNMMEDISKITPALEGVSEKSAESGRLYDAKLKTSKAATNPFYEVKSLTRSLIANDYVELSPHVYEEEERVIPVRNSYGALGYAMINLELDGTVYNDIRSVKARAILDEGDNTQAALEESYQENMALANTLIASGATYLDIPWSLIIQNSPIRNKKMWIDYFNKRQQILQQQADMKYANEQMTSLIDAASMMEPKPIATAR